MRLIDADALKKEIKRTYCTGCDNYSGLRCKACATNDALDMVEDAPTIDAEPVRHGRWIFDSGVDYCEKCSECKSSKPPHYISDNYCPTCGAKMDLEVQDERNV